MDYKIEYSTNAIKSLEQIYDYISKVLFNTIAAENTINGIFAVINNLKLFPNMYAATEFYISKKIPVHIALYKNYKILYSVFDKDYTVVIYDIISSRQNYSN